MMITVILGYWVRKMGGRDIVEETMELNLHENSKVKDVIKELSLTESQSGTITINGGGIDGELVSHELLLKEGDVLKIYPKMLGY